MTNENDEPINSEAYLKKHPLADLALTPVGALIGFGAGRIRSWVDPFAIIHEINHVRNKGINTLTDYSTHLFGAIGYGTGVYNIVSSLCEDPYDIKNYVPLIANLVGAGLQAGLWAYNQGTKNGFNQRIEKGLGEKVQKNK